MESLAMVRLPRRQPAGNISIANLSRNNVTAYRQNFCRLSKKVFSRRAFAIPLLLEREIPNEISLRNENQNDISGLDPARRTTRAL
jgi:hypothetical protein